MMVSTRILCGLSLIISCQVWGSHGHSFLFVPVPVATSHCREMMGIGRALIERGHTVHLLVPETVQVNRCVPEDLRGSVQVKTFSLGPELSELIASSTYEFVSATFSEHGGFVSQIRSLRHHVSLTCRMYAGARSVLDHFNKEAAEGRKLNMIIIDGLPFLRCLSIIPEYLQTPFALVSSFIIPHDSSMPWPVTSYPHLLTDLPGRMNFRQRLMNTVVSGTAQLIYDVLFSTAYHQGNDFGEGLANFDPHSSQRKAVLFLENTDYILDYSKATYPNFIQVGGLTTRPAKPMSGDLQKFFDSSKKGVVIVSFGSFLYKMSQPMTDKLLSAMTKVNANVLMPVNKEKASVKIADHVKTVDWFPQNDALGHVNTRLFVSHCGKNGFFEAVYHGVPILCTPLTLDSFGTSARVSEFGVGSFVDIKTVTSEQLAQVINRLLEDTQVHKMMKMYSTMFHDRPETPGHRGAKALEHVIKYGGHHLRPTTTELNFIQYTGLDVFFVLIVTMLLVTTILLFGCFTVIRKSVGLLVRFNREKVKKE